MVYCQSVACTSILANEFPSVLVSETVHYRLPEKYTNGHLSSLNIGHCFAFWLGGQFTTLYTNTRTQHTQPLLLLEAHLECDACTHLVIN